MKKASVKVYQSLRCQYQLLSANERGHYGIEPMAVELRIWQGRYQNLELPWLHWWNNQGDLLQTDGSDVYDGLRLRNPWLLN